MLLHHFVIVLELFILPQKCAYDVSFEPLDCRTLDECGISEAHIGASFLQSQNVHGYSKIQTSEKLFEDQHFFRPESERRGDDEMDIRGAKEAKGRATEPTAKLYITKKDTLTSKKSAKFVLHTAHKHAHTLSKTAKVGETGTRSERKLAKAALTASEISQASRTFQAHEASKGSAASEMTRLSNTSLQINGLDGMGKVLPSGAGENFNPGRIASDGNTSSTAHTGATGVRHHYSQVWKAMPAAWLMSGMQAAAAGATLFWTSKSKARQQDIVSRLDGDIAIILVICVLCAVALFCISWICTTHFFSRSCRISEPLTIPRSTVLASSLYQFTNQSLRGEVPQGGHIPQRIFSLVRAGSPNL